MIGFGTSLSGVAGGLSAVTSGPDAVPAAQTTPTKLNNAVVALASKNTGGGPGAGPGNGSNDVNGGSTGGGTGGGSTGDGTSGGGGGGGSTNPASIPNPPDIPLPGGGGGGGGGGAGAGDALNNTVNGVKDVLGGVNNNVSGLLGK